MGPHTLHMLSTRPTSLVGSSWADIQPDWDSGVPGLPPLLFFLLLPQVPWKSTGELKHSLWSLPRDGGRAGGPRRQSRVGGGRGGSVSQMELRFLRGGWNEFKSDNG